MAGDYNKYRSCYADRTTDVNVLTSTDYTAGAGTALVSVRSASHQLFIQRIIVSVTTYAAKTWTLQDSTGTPVPGGFMSVPAAAPTTAGDTQYFFEYGPTGLPLTKGKNLNLLMSATGVAASVRVEAYERLAAGAVAPAVVGGLTN